MVFLLFKPVYDKLSENNDPGGRHENTDYRI